ncbi:MAG: hypothetical protein ACNA8H_02700, partial [Anaerolineales bacterium]
MPFPNEDHWWYGVTGKVYTPPPHPSPISQTALMGEGEGQCNFSHIEIDGGDRFGRYAPSRRHGVSFWNEECWRCGVTGKVYTPPPPPSPISQTALMGEGEGQCN